MSQKINVSELKTHPKNNFFFDDIEGDAWSEFLNSIKSSGVIEPIVITQDKVIVSGHQRVRACKALGINEIEAEVRLIDSEDEVLKQLIETNIRQRGIGNTNPVKFGRCLVELERIYGIQHGGDRKSSGNNSHLKTQTDLADELGVDVKTMHNYKKLASAIPEVQELVESGRVTKTVALSIMKQLSEDEQRQLIETLPGGSKVTEREINFYKDRIKALEEREPEVRTVEVVPDDYEDLKKNLAKARKEVELWKGDYHKQQDKTGEKAREVMELKDELKKTQERLAVEQLHGDLLSGAIYFIAQCGSFIRDVAGYVWIADKLAEIPEREREGYVKAAYAVYSWANVLLQNIERDKDYGKPELRRISSESVCE